MPVVIPIVVLLQLARAARKRPRYALGGTPTVRRNARRIDSPPPKRHAVATRTTPYPADHPWTFAAGGTRAAR